MRVSGVRVCQRVSCGRIEKGMRGLGGLGSAALRADICAMRHTLGVLLFLAVGFTLITNFRHFENTRY